MAPRPYGVVETIHEGGSSLFIYVETDKYFIGETQSVTYGIGNLKLDSGEVVVYVNGEEVPKDCCCYWDNHLFLFDEYTPLEPGMTIEIYTRESLDSSFKEVHDVRITK